ncbi:MAG TPA: hypothetical protein VIK39_06005 [Candidatus Angelobacter sp.]
MAIEFEHRGKKWKTDTPEEAIRLRRELEELDAEEEQFGELDLRGEYDEQLRIDTVWTPDIFWTFIGNIGRQQIETVKALLENPRGITSGKLAERLKLPNEMALAGVLSGLSKQLKKLNLKPAHLYSVNTRWIGENTKEREFVTQRAFDLAAEEVGWPEAERKEDAPNTKKKRK